MTELTRQQSASREKTLLAAVLLSAWAPLATGIAVLLSHSTTQLADFIRRTVELVAVLVSWLVFRYLERNASLDAARRRRLTRAAELSVAAALGCTGTIVLILALSRLSSFQPGGNVYLGFVIAVLGLATNLWFWRRYTVLTDEQHNPITAAQCRLYRAKACLDVCVIVALAAVAISPSHPATRYVDILGSIAVAVYLLWSGVGAAREVLRGRRATLEEQVPLGAGAKRQEHQKLGE